MILICDECNLEFESKRKKRICSKKCARIRADRSTRNWEAENPERVKLYAQRTRRKRNLSGKNKEAVTNRRNTKAGYIDRMLERAKQRTPDTDIDRMYLESLTSAGVCNLTNIPFMYANELTPDSFLSPYAPSLDRIDSKRGYYTDNVHVILAAMNFAKNDMPLDLFLSVWTNIFNHWEECKAVLEEEE